MSNGRVRKSYSYQPRPNEPDLSEQIEKLRELSNSPYFGRSHADIAGMILSKYVPEEVKKFETKK